MNKFVSLLICSSLLMLMSCNKAVNDYNSDFNGYWKSEIVEDELSGTEIQSYLIIGENHNECGLSCDPACLGCECVRFVEGRALVNSSRTKMKIGQSTNTVTLTIDKEPYKNSIEAWVCELNGVLYYKQ